LQRRRSATERPSVDDPISSSTPLHLGHGA
jgi:hypothetical protein